MFAGCYVASLHIDDLLLEPQALEGGVVDRAAFAGHNLFIAAFLLDLHAEGDLGLHMGGVDLHPIH